MKGIKLFLIAICILCSILIDLASCRGADSDTRLDSDCPKEIDLGGPNFIGHVWMTTNLNLSQFKNGDVIPEAQTSQQWKQYGDSKLPAWCYYNNDPSNGPRYGKLYNWYAVNDKRGLAPEGYHVSTLDDWMHLYLYDKKDAADLKTLAGWYNSGNGANTTCFCAYPAGFRTADGVFMNMDKLAGWWAASVINDTTLTTGNSFVLVYDSPYLFNSMDYKSCGYSVRCKRD